MTSVAVEPIYGSVWAWGILALLVVLVITLVAPPTEDPQRRKWLIGLRSAAALILLLAAMRPSLVRTDNRPAAATLVIAADTSKSMTLPDGDGSTRWTTQGESIKRLADGLQSLDETLAIKLIRYAGDSSLLAEASDSESIADVGDAIDRVQPDGAATDLGSALRGAIEATAGQPLAGVVLIGDGTQNSIAAAQPNGANSIAARQTAEVLDSLGVPLWTIAIGPSGGDDASRDIDVSNLPDSYSLFSGNQFDVNVTVEARGLAGQRVPLTISWIDQDDKVSEAASRQLDVRGAKETTGLSIPLTAPAPGVYRLRVEAQPQRGEWVTGNNAQTAFVEVREGGGRVLFIEGPGRPEKTFIMRSLRRFPDLELDDVTIRGRQSWPVQLGAAFEPGRYDIFVLGDLDSSAIGDEQLQRLAERVQAGAGLVTLGGFAAYDVGGYAAGPLAEVLPIRMDNALRRPPVRGAITQAERDARKASQLPGPIRVEIARNHPIVDLGGGDPTAPWKELPGAPGANRFQATKVAAGTQVLLQTPQQEPLFVVGGYGKGRVAALALDSTHRWWRAGKMDAHRRFWRQLILWLMSREETSGDSVIAELDSRRFESEAAPEFRARLQTLEGQRAGVTLSARVIDESRAETELNVTASADDVPRIRGNLPTLAPGFYRLVVSASDESIAADEIAFQVLETSRELARPMADPVYLEQLANLTSAHGGSSYDPVDVAKLIEVIKQRRREAETPVIEKRRLGDGPLSGWLVFVLFAGTLSIEWGLRRAWGMA
ncbi:MAG: VWA domain-containing protein [Planctomycetota bacterium]